MEEAYFYLAKIYATQLERRDLARYVYDKFLEKFPKSKHREFVERLIHRTSTE
jgi:hypothetical protein